jgi:DNA polymerase III delta prime subunit
MTNIIEKDFSYPLHDDKDFLYKIYKKREFYYHKILKRDIMKTYEDIQKYRSLTCKYDEQEPTAPQFILPNFINLNTPYKGVILMHGVGTGKTAIAIRIAEQFKEQLKKYNTKIYVLCPGENTKINFKNELITATGETYIKNKEELNQLSRVELEKEKKIAIFNAMQYYKILSYKTFHKKVLGEKIIEKKIVNNNKIKSYKKNIKGEFEREIVIDKIININNSVIIVDEAHNITSNEFGEALKKIIINSENLRVILLTATPMINYADEIVDLLNYLRPHDDQVHRNKIFTNEKDYNMKIKEGGIEYLKDKARGFISYYRGSIPYTFASRVEKGVIPNGMLFTPIIKCYMEPFQYKTYENANITDILEKSNVSYFIFPGANFAFPGLNNTKTDLIGYYSNDGINTVLSQINTDGPKLREIINKKIFNGSLTVYEENNLLYENEKKNISGLIFKMPYVKQFSIKFYKIINKLSKLYDNKKGCCTAFIYSNFVESGIKLFAEALIQNGYLEYQENYNNYNIKDNTLDYKTGLTYSELKSKNINDFKPAVFLLLTGSNDDSSDDIPEVKQRIIREIFNHSNNINGKYIKFILGSKVMNEGVTLKNCKEVHMLDVFYNIPKSEQVIGRVVRICVHNDVITDTYKFPKVNIYRYAISIDDKEKDKLSSDELLYQKAEYKYLIVKQIERALKEIAFDCPLLLHGNVFPEEVEKYKDCVPPTLENIKLKKNICPALCDFTTCNLKCDSKLLNDKYWDNEDYKELSKNEIDYNTFNDNLALNEIDIVKSYIKNLYKFKYVYLYDEIKELIKKALLPHQANLFDDYFLDQALEYMIPKNENEFNNFNDIIYDKYNRSGYLIQRGKYYIFQPFNENEDVPMYYRQYIQINQSNQISLNNYIKYKYDNIITNKDDNKLNIDNKVIIDLYNFDDTYEYYNNRPENFIVGIIDKNKNTNKINIDNLDLFKIKNMKIKFELPIKGIVCTTKDKQFIIKNLKKLDPKFNYKKLTKEELCLELKNKLLYLEKYSTSKDNNKMTYMIIPYNHPTYPFPYNLEDRIKNYIKKIINIANRNIDISVEKIKNNSIIQYKLSFNNDKYLDHIHNELFNLNCKLENEKWIIIII